MDVDSAPHNFHPTGAPFEVATQAVHAYDWSVLHTPVVTVRRVPQALHCAFGDILETLATAICTSTADNGPLDARTEAYWKLWFLLPRFLLRAFPRARGGQRGQAHVRTAQILATRFQQFHAGNLTELDEFGAEPHQPVGVNVATSTAHDARDVEYIRELVTDGDLSRAMARLDHAPSVVPPSDLPHLLRTLYPNAPATGAPGRQTVVLQAPPEEVHTAIQTHLEHLLELAPRRTASGPDGWRYYHLQCLQRNASARSSVARLLVLLGTDCTPPTVHRCLRTAQLWLVPKPAGGARPLTCTSIWCRLFGRAVARHYKPFLAAYAGTHQAAMWPTVGAELAHRTLSVSHNLRPHTALVGVDLKNAFGLLDRGYALQAMMERAPELAWWCRSMLQNAPTLLYRTGAETVVVQPQPGIVQGDALSPIIFDIALAPVLETCYAGLRAQDPQAQLLAWHDDIVLCALPQAASQAVRHLPDLLACTGLVVNAGKSWWHSSTLAGFPNPPYPPTETPTFLGHNLRTNATGDHAALSHAREEPLWVSEILHARAKRHARLRTLCAAGLPLQLAWVLLRTTCNTDFMYHSRMVGAPHSEYARLDASILEQTRTLLSLPMPWETLAAVRLQQPMRYGGAGFLRASTYGPASYIAAWAQTLPRLAERLGCSSARDLAQHSSFVMLRYPALCAAARTVHGEDVLDADAVTDEHLLRLDTSRLAAVQVHDDACAPLSDPSLPKEDRAFIRSCSGPGASAWMQAHTSEDHYLEDAGFVQARLFRLRQPFVPNHHPCQHWNSAANMICGQTMNQHADHATVCLAGGHAIRRHNALVQTLARLLGLVPLNTVDMEPIAPAERPLQPNARPDLAWKLPGQPQRMADVQITSALATQALQRSASATTDGRAAQLAEQRKRCEWQSQNVVPIVFETGGRPGQATTSLVRWLDQQLGSTSQIWQSLSVSLQRAQAQQIRAAILR